MSQDMPIKIADALVNTAERVPFSPTPKVEYIARAIHTAMSTQRDWVSEAPTMKAFYRECAFAANEAERAWKRGE